MNTVLDYRILLQGFTPPDKIARKTELSALMKKTLLIVDENERVRDLTRLAFEGEFRVIESGTFEEALGLLETEKPDALILDVEFQGKRTGWSLIEGALKKEEGRPVMIIVTRDPQANLHPLVHYADGFFAKPAAFALIRSLLKEKGIL